LPSNLYDSILKAPINQEIFVYWCLYQGATIISLHIEGSCYILIFAL